jgi:hypothetical protein
MKPMNKTISCLCALLVTFICSTAYSSESSAVDITTSIQFIRRGRLYLSEFKDGKNPASSANSILIYRSGSLEIVPRGSIDGINAILENENFNLADTPVGHHELISALLIFYSGLDEVLLNNHYFVSRLAGVADGKEQLLQLQRTLPPPSITTNGEQWEAAFFSIRETIGEAPIHKYIFGGGKTPFRIKYCRLEFVQNISLSHTIPR